MKVPLALLVLALSSALLAAEEARPAGDVKVAGVEVPTPERTKFVMPTFPPEALSRGVPALVVVELVIDEHGKVAEAKVLHGTEPYAQAALEAVRKWEYKPSHVDGRAVRVRHTLPINFAVRLPDMKRANGVPELRQGVAPTTPAETRGKSATVVAALEIDPEGRVAEAIVKSGESPWSEALLDAIKTWRFAALDANARVAFEVRAEFKDNKVALDLADPRKVTATAAATPPGPTTDGVPITPRTANPETAAEEPTTAPPTSTPSEAPASPATAAAATPAPPPVEVVSTVGARSGMVNTPPEPGATPPPVENGLSSIRDVELTAGIPDLVRGRRPVSPPVARLGGIEGDVEIRFSIDSGGVTSVHNATGRDDLKEAAESLVRSWVFRRTAPHRLYALAEVHYGMNGSRARIRLVP